MKKLFYIILLGLLSILPIIPALAGNFGLNEAAPPELPRTEIAPFIGNIIKGFLALTGILFLIFTVYGGAMYMLSRGDPTKAKSAREIIYNSLIGIVIIMGAYALTSFIIARVSGTP